MNKLMDDRVSLLLGLHCSEVGTEADRRELAAVGEIDMPIVTIFGVDVREHERPVAQFHRIGNPSDVPMQFLAVAPLHGLGPTAPGQSGSGQGVYRPSIGSMSTSRPQVSHMDLSLPSFLSAPPTFGLLTNGLPTVARLQVLDDLAELPLAQSADRLGGRTADVLEQLCHLRIP